MIKYLLLFLIIACGQKQVSGGEVTIQNDILDKDYNSFIVDQVLTDRGIAPYKLRLSPGEKAVIPYQKISKMRFVRRYEDHSKVYIVTCPSNFNEAITVKLIDVHTNRLGGGCELSRRGRMSLGGLIKWE